jgi:hypothetical protein
VASLLVGLVVLPVALGLVPRFGTGACSPSVPVFYIEPTRVTIVPVRKVFGRVGIGCATWCLVVRTMLGCWRGDVGIVVVVVV